MSYEKREPIEATVAELKPSMKNVTISFKVIEIGDEREIISRKDNTTHTVVDVVIGDSTGIIRMPLWDDGIDKIEDGKTYVLTNGYTALFRNNLQINVGRYGNLAESEDEIEEINMNIDMSEKEYEDTRRRQYDNRDRDNRGYRGQNRGYDNRRTRDY